MHDEHIAFLKVLIIFHSQLSPKVNHDGCHVLIRNFCDEAANAETS